VINGYNITQARGRSAVDGPLSGPLCYPMHGRLPPPPPHPAPAPSLEQMEHANLMLNSLPLVCKAKHSVSLGAWTAVIITLLS
jgi:hypothetical protein